MTSLTLADAVRKFGIATAERFATGGGEPEDLLRGPFENLLADVADLSGITNVVPTGEHHLADDRVRPDYAIFVDGALVGFAELKAPGKGADPTKYKGHDHEQWERLACLPNVLYTDGQAYALYRNGERVGPIASFSGDVQTAGAELTAQPDDLLTVFEAFLRWEPVTPRRPRELALITARLCRLLRAEVEELLATEEGLQLLAEDWRALLFPEATDTQFADGYAQTVTFALLLARVEGITVAGRDLRDVADELGEKHTLMGRALDVLTNPSILPKLAVSVSTLQRVIGVVDWPTLSKNDPAAWLYFYEDFLEGYDAELRRATGSYYTPVQVVDPMVRLVDDLIKTRFGHAAGFAAPEVTVVDPSAGTGTFLFRIIDSLAARVEASEGIGAVGPRLRQAIQRLIGFELQAGPFSVAELRLSTELARRDAAPGPKELRLYLTDTLANPFESEEHLPALYAPIALSRQSANEVKRNENVMVVIGNPPYRERSRGKGGWIEHGNPGAGQAPPLAEFIPPKTWKLSAHVKHLYNPYVYFWRWAMWKVFEGNPGDRGIVAFITVAGFVNGPGFAAMRSHLRRAADEVWVIDCSPEGHQPDVPTRIFPGVQRPICIMIAARDGSTDATMAAPVHFTAVSGAREKKFESLKQLELDDPAWLTCSSDWTAPFLPMSGAEWASFPALEDVLAWSGSGTMPGRTWVISPSPKTLAERWSLLVAAPLDEKSRLLSEHPRDRTIHTRLKDNLPGYEVAQKTLGEEDAAAAPAVRYAFRSFDRQWIVPDKRVINQPNPSLWQIRNAPGQLFLTGLNRTSPTSGPALTATALIPDLDHFHSRGGRAWPLWLDSAASHPNILPGLLSFLGSRLGTPVSAGEFFAYVAAIVSSCAYTSRFADDLAVPGLRIPLTSDVELFADAVDLGKRILWLHTFGERFADETAGRPVGPPMLPEGQRPKVMTTIPDDAPMMPTSIDYAEETATLFVGTGTIAPVQKKVWEYDISGVRVIRRWFERRKKEPEGRKFSPLDSISPATWSPEWTTELLEMINMISMLTDLDPAQEALLDRLLASPLVSVADLTAADLLPPQELVKPEKARARGSLFDAGPS